MTTGEDKWTLILGVSGGVGAAIARSAAAKPGLNVFGVHRGKSNPEEAGRVKEAVEVQGRKCHIHEGPVGTHEEVVAAAEELQRVAGPKSVRLMVHAIANASYGSFTGVGFPAVKPVQVARTFESMAHTYLYWVQELSARGLLADGSLLLALSNPMVDSAVKGWGLIAACKAALETYVHQIAHELGPQGYHVAMLKFGLVETRAIKIPFPDKEWARVKGEVCSLTPARRLCTVEEVASFVSYLAEDGGRWFNGTTIDFSGGQAGCMLDKIFNLRLYPAGLQ